MIRVSSIPPSPENKRNQIRKNILEGTYSKKINIAFQTFENPRLQFRFAEALDEAYEKCYVREHQRSVLRHGKKLMNGRFNDASRRRSISKL